MSRILGPLAMLLIIFPAIAKGQGGPIPGPGDRIRVTAPDCQLRQQKGVLTSVDRDLFIGTIRGEEIQCPSEALTRLDVSVGERRWWKGSLIGLGVGLGVGGIGVIAITSDPAPGDDMYGLAAALWAIATTSTGLVLGTVVGLIRGSDTWREVPLPLFQPSLFVSRGNRLGFGFSIPLKR